MCDGTNIRYSTSKDTFVATIDDDYFILQTEPNKDNLNLVCALQNRRDITNALDLMAYLSTLKPITKKGIHIGDNIFDVYIEEDGRKYITSNSKYKLFIGTHEGCKQFISSIIASLLFRLVYIYGIDTSIADLVKSSSDSNIITIQPHGSMFKYSIIKISDDYYTLNIVGNTSYNPLITDYQSDGVYECKEVNICTIISQDILLSDYIENLYTIMK